MTAITSLEEGDWVTIRGEGVGSIVAGPKEEDCTLIIL